VIRLAERFGRVGRVGDRVTLTGPWYPLVVDGDAYRFDVPHRVRVETTEPYELLVGARRAASGEAVTQRGAFVPVLGARSLHERRVEVGGRELVVVAPTPFYAPPAREAAGVEALEDVVRVDVPARVADATRDVLTTLREADVVHDREAPIVVAVVPSRVELAATAPGLVLVADDIYEIFPLDVTIEFHHRALRRALFRHLVAPISTQTERPRDRDWADDLRAVLLTDVDDARRHGVARTPEELVGFAAFHPAIDQLLYAPQIQYVEVFFGAIDEPDFYRDDPAEARLPVARGRRVLESARDALDDDELRRFSAALLGRPRRVREILRDIDDAAARRLPVWLDTPNREVNYRIGARSSERLANGRYRARVEVVREGANRPEPVEVELRDARGNVEIVTWDGEGGRGVVEAEMAGELSDVHIDPRHRLPQSPALADGHPRGDDATSKPFRPPLLRGFGLNLALSEGNVFGYIDFAMRRLYDLEEQLAVTLSHLSSTTGGTLRYIRGIGPKRTTNARIASFNVGLDFDRVREEFVNAGTGGWRLSLVGGAGFDTRAFFIDPREGSSLGVNFRVGGTLRDDESVGFTGSVVARGSHTIGLGTENALLLVAGGGMTFGDALAGELQQLGGRFLLRGFDTSELVGRGAAFAVAEHRYTAFRDLSWNILHLAWLREIQLAAWGGVGILFDREPTLDVGFAAEAGFGLRFHYEYAGVQPGVLSVDLGIPLSRDPNAEGSDGRLGRDRLPFGLHLSFDQYF
jgi:hypothetical protein